MTELPCGCDSFEINWGDEELIHQNKNQYLIQGACPCGEQYSELYIRRGIVDEEMRTVVEDPSVFEFGY